MDPRSWSTGFTWFVVLSLFIVANVLRALTRAWLLPEHVRLTGLLGLALWFGWLTFAFYIWVIRKWAEDDRKRHHRRQASTG
jgi:hypothetical protein